MGGEGAVSRAISTPRVFTTASVPARRQPVGMAVDDTAMSNAHDADDDVILVNRVDDAVVTRLRPVQMVSADDAAHARPTRIDREALK